MLFSQKQFIIIANAPEKVRETPLMKRCPQCNTVFRDELVYCPNDGTTLVKESFSLPSESDFEDETIIRREPIVVDLSNKNHAPNVNPPAQQYAPPVEDVIVRVPAKNNGGKYALFLLVGLLLGGGLVLATLLLTRNSATDNANSNLKINPTTISETPEMPKKTASPPLNANADIADSIETASDIHSGHTADADDEFNGRVISLNAYIREAPSRNSAQIDILPIDDRLTITTRENPNSPWFYVVCEHGTSGWMHGNTIEYTR